VKVRPAVTEERLASIWVPFVGDEDADPALGALIVEGATPRLNLTRGVAVQVGRKAVEVEPLSGLHSVVSIEGARRPSLTGLAAAARRDVLIAIAALTANDPQVGPHSAWFATAS